MNRILTVLSSVLSKIFAKTASVVAVLLIIAAAVIGYRLGTPPPVNEPVAEPASGEGPSNQLYTCSMHPSVRLPDPEAKCPICFMDLIPVAEDTGDRLVLTAEAAERSRIDTAKAGRYFPTAEVRLYGQLAFDETSVSRITAYFPGRLDRLFVNYVGVPVQSGDHLAEIYSPDLLIAFESLRQARLAVDANAAASDLVRRSSQRTLSASRERLRLLGLDEDQIRAAEESDEHDDHLTIHTPMDGIVTHLAAREGDYVQTGSPIATVANLNRLWLDMEAYESQLPMLRWGQSVTFTVEAHPGSVFEGRISFIEPVVDTRTRTAAVRVAVDNSDLKLKPGMFATAIVRPRVAQGGAVLSDELAGRWVGPMHPTVVRDGPGQCDICGMDLVPAESLGVVGDPSTAEEPIVIPRSAVLHTGARSVVYVEVPGTDSPTYEGRMVTLGPRVGDFYIIADGLQEGESVVVNGAFRIDSAMQIAAKPSMMSPSDSGADSRIRPAHSSKVRESFLHSLKPVYAAYFGAQESLAADDLAGFMLSVSDMQSALSFVSETGLVGEPLSAWRRAASKLRVDDSFTDIEVARARFERMSAGAIALQRQFGHIGSETWQLAYCPMAFNNKGAEWLQRGTEIDNSYEGSRMRRCGEIRQSFAPINDVSDPMTDATSQPSASHEGHDHE